MSIPTFQAVQTHDMQSVIDSINDLLSILHEEGRLVSVSMPNAAVEMVNEFKDVLEDLHVTGKVHVAHKATASIATISALKNYASIDVASEQELTSALKAGYKSSQIIATGPKSSRFLTKLIELRDATIIVDSCSELERLIALSKGTQVKILLRLTRTLLNIPGVTKRSRFGLDNIQLQQAMPLIKANGNVSLKGLAFHLDSESIIERQYAVQKAIDALLSIQQAFPEASILDIGGGYGTNYGVSQADLIEYEAHIKTMLTSDVESFTWHSHSFGLSNDGTRIRGDLTGIDKYNGAIAVERLKAILTHKEPAGATIAEQLNDHLIELWIEPGSSIFSASGLIATEIIDMHQRDGENFIVVDAHRNQICFEGNEHIADPILIENDPLAKSEPFEAYIVGHLCMESDFMMYRKIKLPRKPEVGDGLAWLHTGAYRSHFSSSASIGHPSAVRYVLRQGELQKEKV